MEQGFVYTRPMYPILGRYGPFFLYSYTVVLGLGIAASLGLTAYLANRQRRLHDGWLDGLLLAIFAGLVGGRAGYVWANGSYFRENPAEAPLVWQGGLSYHGVLLFGLVAFWLWTVWRGRSFSRDAALLAPGLALTSAAGWLACWLEGCAYGRETVLGPLAGDLPDSFGVYGLRYQTQLLGLGLSSLTLLAVLVLRGRLRDGQPFWLTLLLLSAGQVAISFLRGDAMPTVGTWRVDSLLNLVLALLGLVGLLATWLSTGRRRRYERGIETGT